MERRGREEGDRGRDTVRGHEETWKLRRMKKKEKKK